MTGAAPAGAGLRVLVVDDEAPALADLVWQLDQDPRVARTTGAGSAGDALRYLEAHTFDAIFLDIRMPGLDGLDLARLIARFGAPPSIVFVTAYDDFAVDAFALAAVDYLLKPVEGARLSETLRRLAAARAGSDGDRREDDVVVPVELGGVSQLVHRSDVLWVEAHGDYVRLHTTEGAHLVRVPLGTLEEEWAEAGFVRIHRSLLVSASHVAELRVESGRTKVVLGGTVLTVSRRHSRDLRERLGLLGPRRR